MIKTLLILIITALLALAAQHAVNQEKAVIDAAVIRHEELREATE